MFSPKSARVQRQKSKELQGSDSGPHTWESLCWGLSPSVTKTKNFTKDYYDHMGPSLYRLLLEVERDRPLNFSYLWVFFPLAPSSTDTNTRTSLGSFKQGTSQNWGRLRHGNMARHSKSPVKPRKMKKPAKAPFFMGSVIREIRKAWPSWCRPWDLQPLPVEKSWQGEFTETMTGTFPISRANQEFCWWISLRQDTSFIC